jgi:hypothetical protein
MRSGLFWRRSTTAVWLYVSVGFGIFGTIVAANVLGPSDFGVFATALAAAAFFQTLLDLTVEDSLTKFSFRYIERKDWGRPTSSTQMGSRQRCWRQRPYRWFRPPRTSEARRCSSTAGTTSEAHTSPSRWVCVSSRS